MNGARRAAVVVDALAAPPGSDAGGIEPDAADVAGTPASVVVVDVVVVGWFARWSLVGGRIVLPSPVSQAAADRDQGDRATAARTVDDRAQHGGGG